MRVLKFTAVVVVILSAGLAVYLDYDQRRFENSLPKAPRLVSSQAAKDIPSTGIKNIEISHEMAERDAPSDLLMEPEDVVPRREKTEDADTFFGMHEEGIRQDERRQETDTEEPSVSLAPQKPRGISLADWLRSLSRTGVGSCL